jgi:flagellar hook-associated protein 3 FlgL
MRVPSNLIYDRGVASMQQLWSSLVHVQQEMATGRRVLTPADDPIAAARALDITQSQSVNKQFKTNQDYSGDNLKLLDNKLNSAVDILQYMRQQAVGAGNGILTQNELNFFATDMHSQFDALLSLANTQDATGDFLFSGYRANTQPFQGGYGNVSYAGDQGTRTMQVSSSRYMPVSLPGSDVFDNTRSLQGAPNIYAGAGNTGSATINVDFDSAQPDPANTGRRYEVTATGPYVFEVVEYQPGIDTPQPVAGSPFTGTPMTFNGITVEVPGAVTGDTFEVFVPSKNVFDNLAVFIDTLEHPGPSGVINGVKFAIDNIDAELDTILTVRAQVGSQLNEIEQLNDLAANMDLQYADVLKRLQECDPIEAASRLTQFQYNLEASMSSFMKVSGLSLFNFLS